MSTELSQGEQPRKISPEELRSALEEFDKTPDAPILLAAMARDRKSDSWRNFLVGCAVFTASLSERKINHFFAGNYKKAPGPKTEEDKCAERKAVEQALKSNPDIILAIVTVSKESLTGHESGSKHHDILHPCSECRNMFGELLDQGLLSLQSRIICVKDAGKFAEGSYHIEDHARNYQYEKVDKMTLGELLG